MAGRPKEARFRAALTRLAEREDMQPLDWVVAQLESGISVRKIGDALRAEAGEESSPQWIYTLLHGLAPEAKERVREARKVGATALADQALEIADRPATSTAEVQANRLAVDTRRWIASSFDRATFGDAPPKVELAIDLGQLHLEALRRRAVTVERVPEQLPAGPDYEVLPRSDPQAPATEAPRPPPT
jgi:Bacteriophage Sf6, terminase small subunit-like